MLQIGVQAQAGEQRFVQKPPAGGNGQKMRLVHHNQIIVQPQDFFVKRNARLGIAADFAVVKKGFSRLEGRVFV